MARPAAPPIVFLDACVLYPHQVRGILLRLAEAGLFRPAWTPRVLEEWRIAATRNGVAHAEAAVVRMALRMAASFPDARVTADPAVEQSLHLPDPADAHVLAGAIAAGAGQLLTFNMRDFPARRLVAHGIVPRHPDGFLWEMLSEQPEIVGQAVRQTAAETGVTDPDAIRKALRRAHLPRFAKAWLAMENGAG
jgi:predicted nucleic acid-binding protein